MNCKEAISQRLSLSILMMLMPFEPMAPKTSLRHVLLILGCCTKVSTWIARQMK